MIGETEELIIALDLTVAWWAEFSGRLPPVHQEWIRRLPRTVRRSVVASFAAPYAATYVPATVSFYCAYSYDPASIEATTEVVFGERPALGRLPVKVSE